MSKIKDYYKKAPSIQLPPQTAFHMLRKPLTGVGINLDVTEDDIERKETNYEPSRTITKLQIGDILFNTRDPKEAKLVHSLPNQEVYAGPAIFVLRRLQGIPKDIKPLPAWAIVITARRHGSNWIHSTMMGNLGHGRDLLEHKFEIIPDENPAGIKLLDHAEKLLALKTQLVKTMEEFHYTIAYRMLKNLPLSDKKPINLVENKRNDEKTVKDCPHCGAKASELDKENGKGVYVYMDSPGKSQESTKHVVCLECGSGSPTLEIWNHRKNSSQ